MLEAVKSKRDFYYFSPDLPIIKKIIWWTKFALIFYAEVTVFIMMLDDLEIHATGLQDN